jgi:hypothetical protein
LGIDAAMPVCLAPRRRLAVRVMHHNALAITRNASTELLAQHRRPAARSRYDAGVANLLALPVVLAHLDVSARLCLGAVCVRANRAGLSSAADEQHAEPVP